MWVTTLFASRLLLSLILAKIAYARTREWNITNYGYTLVCPIYIFVHFFKCCNCTLTEARYILSINYYILCVCICMCVCIVAISFTWENCECTLIEPKRCLLLFIWLNVLFTSSLTLFNAATVRWQKWKIMYWLCILCVFSLLLLPGIVE